MKTLQDLFLDELGDMYYAEKQLVKALPKMAKAATHDALRSAIESHLEETEGHVRAIEAVFKSFGETPRAKKCEAILGLLKEGEEIVEENEDEPTLNAAIISAAQKVEHYEIASYGCLVEWAGQLDAPEAVEHLEGILDQEKAADTALTKLARERFNEAAESESKDTDSEEAEPGGKRSGRVRTAAR